VTGFDIDSDALDTYRCNVDDFDIHGCDAVCTDVLTLQGNPRLMGVFDTVVMNPPFGTKHNKGTAIKSDIFSRSVLVHLAILFNGPPKPGLVGLLGASINVRSSFS